MSAKREISALRRKWRTAQIKASAVNATHEKQQASKAARTKLFSKLLENKAREILPEIREAVALFCLVHGNNLASLGPADVAFIRSLRALETPDPLDISALQKKQQEIIDRELGEQ